LKSRRCNHTFDCSAAALPAAFPHSTPGAKRF
jgi:hypothetical protein